jgi:hypothetical protein
MAPTSAPSVRTFHRTLTAAFAALAGAGCASDASGSNPVVQIAEVAASPKTVSCNGGAVAPDSIAWDIRLVNTTDEDVLVVRAASAGVIIRAPDQTMVGNPIASIADVPFTPDSAPVVALRGDREIRVSLPAAPFCLPPAQWKDVYVSIRVIAGSWQLVTQWEEFAVR